MSLLKHTIYVFFAMIFIACTNFDDVQVRTNPDEIKVKSVKGSTFKMHIPVEVDNPTTKTIILKKVKFDVLKKGYSFAKMELDERVEFSANSNGKYIIVLNGRITDRIGAMFSRFSIKAADEENYTLSGFAKLSAGAFSKKIKLKNQSFSELVNIINNK